MKDVKNKKRAGGGFFSSVGEGVSTQLARWRTSPSALLSDLAALAVAFLFARCHIVFGARPVAMGFIALLPSRVFAALIGAALGALSLGSGGAAYAIIYTLTVALRIILSGALGEGGRPFEESLPVRLSIATVGGFVLSVYQLLVAGFGAAELLFGLSMTLLSPVACFILAGIL